MRALHLIDSITEITPAMGDAVIVSGSHGGRSAAAFALAVRPSPRAVFFNDAGVGKGGAGIVALQVLEQAGIAAAAATGLEAGQTVAAAVSLLRMATADGGACTSR